MTTALPAGGNPALVHAALRLALHSFVSVEEAIDAVLDTLTVSLPNHTLFLAHVVPASPEHRDPRVDLLRVQQHGGPDVRMGAATAPIAACCSLSATAPLLVQDLTQETRLRHLPPHGIGAYLGVPVQDSDGQPYGVLGGVATAPTVWADPSETVGVMQLLAHVLSRQLATHDLRQQAAQAQAHLQAILDVLPVGVAIADAQGVITQVNPAFHTIWDHTPLAQGLATFGTYQGWWPDGRVIGPTDWALARALIAGETCVGDEIIIQTVTGQRKTIRNAAAPLVDAQGRRTGAVVAEWDITEQRRLEQRTHETLAALLAMADVLAVVPESIGEPLAAVASGVITTATQATVQHLLTLTQRVLHSHYTATAILDRETATIQPLAVVGVTPEREQQWWRDLPQTPIEAYLPLSLLERLATQEVVVLDREQQHAATCGVAQILIVPVRLATHRLLLLSVETRDGAPFLPQEVDLAQAAARLMAQVLERERLLRARTQADAQTLAAQETNEQMQTFVGIVGHELRTPVTSVRATVQLAERTLRASLAAAPPTSLDAKLKRAQGLLAGTDRQILRLNRLIEDLMDMTRIASGKLDLRRATHDLGDLVREVLATQRLIWPQRVITLALPAGPVPVWMDADRVEQVVTNYVGNALKYAPEDRPVAVTVTVEATDVRVAVQDEGPGLAPEAQEHLWEPFHQVTGIRQQSGSGIGLGLGLHISKTIITQHGGAVGVASVVGAGSTFWFTVPCAVAAETPT